MYGLKPVPFTQERDFGQIPRETSEETMLPIVNSIAAAVPGLSGLAGAGSASFLPSAAGGAPAPAPFSDLLTDAVGQVDQLENQAKVSVTGLMTGTGVDVHEAMIATQKASMAFELTLAVRNKAVQAYQSVIGMQF
jgi:flagellar hook-basal body complex protein FliE